jgi:hypothetical protein
MANEDSGTTLVQSISDNLGPVFRHLFPGVLIVGAAAIAHPSWFSGLLDAHSWPHLVIAAVVTLAVGNAWFAFNRYGVHQLVDYVMYLLKWQGPGRTASFFTSLIQYNEDVGKYAAESLCIETIPSRARQHVAFRASSVLLLYIVAEIAFVAWYSHEPATLFDRHPRLAVTVSAVIALVALWQDAITRRIDYHVIDFGRREATTLKENQ